MKINSAIPSVSNTTSTGRAGGLASEPPRAEAPSAERVDISAASVELLETSGAEAPVNAERVAEIKQAIAEGRFQINPERIADGLLASVRDMLGRGKPA